MSIVSSLSIPKDITMSDVMRFECLMDRTCIIWQLGKKKKKRRTTICYEGKKNKYQRDNGSVFMFGLLFNQRDCEFQSRFIVRFHSTVYRLKHFWGMFQVAIVVGGGNIFRGASAAGNSGLDRSSADYIGYFLLILID